MMIPSPGVRCISLWPKPENREATPHVAATVSKDGFSPARRDPETRFGDENCKKPRENGDLMGNTPETMVILGGFTKGTSDFTWWWGLKLIKTWEIGWLSVFVALLLCFLMWRFVNEENGPNMLIPWKMDAFLLGNRPMSWLSAFPDSVPCTGRPGCVEDWNRWSQSTGSSRMAETRPSRLSARRAGCRRSKLLRLVVLYWGKHTKICGKTYFLVKENDLHMVDVPHLY